MKVHMRVQNSPLVRSSVTFCNKLFLLTVRSC